jgi:inosose dehydratase
MIRPSRRTFLKSFTASAMAAPMAAGLAQAATEAKLHIACNQFCWLNMYRRSGKDFNADLDAGFAQVKRSGIDGVETMLGDVAAAELMIPLLKKHGLAMRSFYSSATLHDPATRDANIEHVVATAKRSKELIDSQIVVVNPTPLKGQAKSNAQLATQADAMTSLGERLAEFGTTLAYHFHAPAWQDNGREFHHVMTKTDGDIDYRQVADGLNARGVRPLLVLEQAVEKGTPNTMDAIESHRRSRAYVEDVFAAFTT